MICPVCNTSNTPNSDNCQQCNSNLQAYKLLYQLNKESYHNNNNNNLNSSNNLNPNKNNEKFLLYISLLVNIMILIIVIFMFCSYIMKDSTIHSNIIKDCQKQENQVIDQETLRKFQDIILLELSLYNKQNSNSEMVAKH